MHITNYKDQSYEMFDSFQDFVNDINDVLTSNDETPLDKNEIEKFSKCYKSEHPISEEYVSLTRENSIWIIETVAKIVNGWFFRSPAYLKNLENTKLYFDRSQIILSDDKDEAVSYTSQLGRAISVDSYEGHIYRDAAPSLYRGL